jgi:hypothetical protein
MSLRNTLFFVCLIVSVLCLAAGYAVAGQWVGAGAAILIGPAWVFARKYPASWLPLICLLASVGLAVMGRLSGSPALLMICGAGVALAVWDLLILIDAMGNHPSGEQPRKHEKRHIQSLALALGSGLLLACFGRSVNLQIPFAILVLFIALLLFGLDRTWVYLKRSVAKVDENHG